MDNYHILTRQKDTSIYNLMRSIKTKDNVRISELSSPFNFDRQKSLEFLESIVSGRPFHVVFINPDKRLNSRSFEINCLSHSSESVYTNEVDHTPYYILDGFQRLQCLYSAFFGHFDGARIFYDTSYIEEAGGERFFFSKKKRSTRSEIRLNMVNDRAKRTKLPRNWMFDSIMKNLEDFQTYFHDHSILRMTIINVIGSGYECHPWFNKSEVLLGNFIDKMSLFVNLLNKPEEEAVFYQIGNRLKEFIELATKTDHGE
jgi:hypothetical protein